MADRVADTISFLPEIVILNISRFLPPRDVVRWARTSKHFHQLLPQFVAMVGKPFHIHGPSIYRGEGTETYFEGPILQKQIRRLNMSIVWKDQGWGNKKGDVFVSLVRGETVVHVKHAPFGICDHVQRSQTVELRTHPVVTGAMPGDFYRFTRHPGGGGGHRLIVKKFIAIAELY